MPNDAALLDTFEHYRRQGISAQSAMAAAMAFHATNDELLTAAARYIGRETDIEIPD
jgi:hypothetical protein